MNNLSIIAAIGKNNELGINNDLVFKSKEDMKFFRDKTINHNIILGRKTLESLPNLLKDRHHLVLTKSKIDNKNVTCFSNISDLLDYTNNINDEVFVIGGAKIYKEFIDIAYKMYLTEVDREYIADTFFPYFNKDNFNRELIYKDKDYKRYIYTRKK